VHPPFPLNVERAEPLRDAVEIPLDVSESSWLPSVTINYLKFSTKFL
jgi:hypothetical protein